MPVRGTILFFLEKVAGRVHANEKIVCLEKTYDRMPWNVL